MKLIGKQIVVELPDKASKENMAYWERTKDLRAYDYHLGKNEALTEVAKMNPAVEVDGKKISEQIFCVLPNLSGVLSMDDMDKIANALASDPSRWLKEVKCEK